MSSQTIIAEWQKNSREVFVISSELNELLAACDRIIVMSDGKIAKDIARSELDSSSKKLNAAEAMQFAEHRLQETLQEVRSHV